MLITYRLGSFLFDAPPSQPNDLPEGGVDGPGEGLRKSHGVGSEPLLTGR